MFNDKHDALRYIAYLMIILSIRIYTHDMKASKNNASTTKEISIVRLWTIVSLLLCAMLVSLGQLQHSVNAQSVNSNSSGGAAGQAGSHVDSSPYAAVITITRDSAGSVVFQPNNVTIKAGEEIVILNNDTKAKSFTNGNGRDDPLAGKLFDTGLIQPKQFAEYTAANIGEGTYSFYSEGSPMSKGTLVVAGVKL